MIEFAEYGYIGLFAASFLSATVLPLASEAIVGVMIVGKFDPWLCLIIATIGNWMGGLTTYYLGYLGKWEWIEKYLRIKKEKVEKTKSYLDKYGSFVALMSWAPILGDALAVALGFFKVNKYEVALFMFIGKLARYSVIVYLVLLGMK